MKITPEYRTSPARRFWPLFLVVAGTVLLAATAVMIAGMVAGRFPLFLMAVAGNLAIWSPIMLVAGIVLRVHYARTERLLNHGLRGTLRILDIQQTASRVGGRGVVRLTGSVAVPARAATQVTVRVAPPLHLTQLLRRGAELPVKVDPEIPTRLRIDWAAVEDATTPPTSLCPPGW